MAAKKAAKKKASKKKVAARGGGRAVAVPTDWATAMQQYATDDKARTASTEGNVISIRGGSFKFQGQDLGDTMRVIILDFTHLRSWYDRPYDEDNPSPPACAAMSYSGDDVVPFGDVPLIQTESGACAECWANEWGSAETGRAKSCKESIRAIVMDPEDDPESAELAVINVPPTSLKKFNGYITSLAKLERPCFAAVTSLSFDEDEDYPVLVPTMDDKTEKVYGKAQLSHVLKRREEATEMLQQKPWDFSQYEAPPQRGRGGKKKAAKKTTKKKAGRGGGGRSKFSQ